MSFPAIPSGLAGLLTDAREFLAAVRVARPNLLWLLLVLPLLALANRYALIRRRRATGAVGRPAAVAGLQTHPRPRRRWLGLAYPLGWVALVLGLAGPRWGKSDEPGVAVGRDLVVVVDLSRSMLAKDLTTNAARWEAARAGLLDLVDAVARRGGHRVAVVAFAAKPKLLVPLTTDYDHVRAVVEELDGGHPPPEVRPGADPNVTSGTRIGAALLAAVDAHDPRFPGSQDIILLSDGDDPADDREWVRGADAARKAGIPVHTVGIGNPDADEFIPLDDGFLEIPAKDGLPPNPVLTRLHEDVLRPIAAETGGQYLPARRDVPRLGEFFRARVEPHPTREVSDDAIPQPKERYAWFLGPAVLLFGVGWLRGR
ncbi:MAG: hypothetical protein JWO38_6327 [Gemmataceae bacterium]|nr:hypothetical protein [Gemmataceae bacterium]